MNKYELPIHAFGIYLSFLVCGYYQEKLVLFKYNNQKFNYFLFVSMLQNIVGVLISYTILKRKEHKIGIERMLLTEYIKCSFLKIVSSYLSYYALSRINYPTLIITKSIKIIPVLVMNYLLFGKKYSNQKYLTALTLTFGVLLFMFGLKKGSNPGKSSIFGIFCVFISLFVDGGVNSIQDFVFKTFKAHSHQMMFYLSAISAAISFVMAISSNEVIEPLLFICKNPSITADLIFLVFFSVFGQVVIYSTLERFGSLTLTGITVTRKIMSILMSIYVYKHPISVVQCIGLVFVFFAFSFEFLEKKAKNIKKE